DTPPSTSVANWKLFSFLRDTAGNQMNFVGAEITPVSPPISSTKVTATGTFNTRKQNLQLKVFALNSGFGSQYLQSPIIELAATFLQQNNGNY
ncbi:hypothetical protein, partial [Salmonella sp. s59944]|uniref:hypothetical protein n=1 Tax=Salmonella sp. s59944 TaxID=3159720 RepID=UPI003980BB6F